MYQSGLVHFLFLSMATAVHPIHLIVGGLNHQMTVEMPECSSGIWSNSTWNITQKGPEIMLQHVAQAWEGEEQVHRTRLGIYGNQPW